MSAAAILKELKALRSEVRRLAERESAQTDLIVTRDEAARQLKMSVRQLQRLVQAGRISVQPSGFARAELERFVRTPQTSLPSAVAKAVHERTPSEEMALGRAQLKAMQKARRG